MIRHPQDTWQVKSSQHKHVYLPRPPFLLCTNQARGVTKEEFPGYYPFREYSTKYWEATHTWVKDYLDVRPAGQ